MYKIYNNKKKTKIKLFSFHLRTKKPYILLVPKKNYKIIFDENPMQKRAKIYLEYSKINFVQQNSRM